MLQSAWLSYLLTSLVIGAACACDCTLVLCAWRQGGSLNGQQVSALLQWCGCRRAAHPCMLVEVLGCNPPQVVRQISSGFCQQALSGCMSGDAASTLLLWRPFGGVNVGATAAGLLGLQEVHFPH
jgi:hypothetical protein